MSNIEEIIKKTDLLVENTNKENLQKLEEANAVTNFLGNAFQFIFNRQGRSWADISRDRANKAIQKAQRLQQKQTEDFKLIANTCAVLDKMPANIGTLTGSKVGPGTKGLTAEQVIEAFGNLFDDNGTGGAKAALTAGIISAAAATGLGIVAAAGTGAAAGLAAKGVALARGTAIASAVAGTTAGATSNGNDQKFGVGIGMGYGYIGKIAQLAKQNSQMAGLYNSYIPQLKEVRKAFHSYCTKKGNPLSIATGILATNKLVYNQKYQNQGFAVFMQAVIANKDPQIDLSGNGDANAIIAKLKAALDANTINKQILGQFMQSLNSAQGGNQ